MARSRRDGAASSPCAALNRKAAACDGAQIGHSAAASHVAPILDVGSSPEPRRHGTQRWRITAVARSYWTAQDSS
jgi:hypothetical protein